MVQDVEKLCPELHAGALRNLPHREVLVDRKIQVNEPRTDNAIAAGIAQEIRATARNRRKRHALRCDRRSGHGHPEATGVDVTQPRIALVVVVHGIASRNAIRNAKCVGAVIFHIHRVPSDEGSGGNPVIQLENAAQLPSVQERASRPVERFRPGYIPEPVDRHAMGNVEVRDGVAD